MPEGDFVWVAGLILERGKSKIIRDEAQLLL